MKIKTIISYLSFLIFTSAANAAVFMEEAAKVSGYGPTRVGYSMWYAGACGERIAASVGYVGHATTDNALPTILQYSRDSVQHLLARCPQAEVIEITAEGQAARPRLFYRFEMRRDDDWAPTEIASNNQLVDALIAGGYLPGSGPTTGSRQAFVKYDNGRLDVIYGNGFEGRMVASYFEKEMMEGAEPPRLSHYTVRGHWYEPGNEQAGGQCAESREGYPLWGSFSMTVYPFGQTMNMQRKPCVNHDEEGKSESGAIADLRLRDFEKFGLEPLKLAKVLSDEIEAAGNFATMADSQEYARTRQPLFESARLRLYAQRPDLCSHLRFDAVYRVNSEQRDSEFDGNYTRELGRLLRRVANQQCESPLTASVDNYSLGDTDKWDHMSFQFRPIRPSPLGGDENYLQLLDHSNGPRAKAHAEWLAANLLGPACTDGPFCSLPGGRYLNAIYRGDLNGVRQMDHIYAEEKREYLRKQIPSGEANNPLADMFNAVLDAEDIHLLREAANKYLYSYPAWGESCLDPGWQARTYEYTTPVIIETDEWGVTTRSGGEHYEATYTLNPEFFPLRDRIAGHGGAADSDDPMNRPAKSQVFLGIVEMKRAYGCRSAEVKQFEQQLRVLTNSILDQPGTIPPTTANRPPVAKKAMAGAFPPVPTAPAAAPSRISISAPAKLPTVAATVSLETKRPAQLPAAPPAAVPQAAPAQRTASVSTTAGSTATAPATSSADVSGMSAAERQKQMSLELQALHTGMQEEMNVLNQTVQQATRSAATGAERTKILVDYQTKIGELQRRAQQETQQIKNKYQ